MQSKIFGVPLAIVILVLAIVLPLGGVSYVNYLQNREILAVVQSLRTSVPTPTPVMEVTATPEATASAKPRKTAVPTPIEEGATVPVAQ